MVVFEAEKSMLKFRRFGVSAFLNLWRFCPIMAFSSTYVMVFWSFLTGSILGVDWEYTGSIYGVSME